MLVCFASRRPSVLLSPVASIGKIRDPAALSRKGKHLRQVKAVFNAYLEI